MKKGFTLIETLMYVGLYTMIIGGMLAGIYSMFESDARNETVAMLEEEGDYLVGKIDWALSDAASVQSPANAGTVLAIIRSDGSSISISNPDEALRIQEGAAPAQAVNNSNVSITNLSFVHMRSIASGSIPESVSASFTMFATTTGGQVLRRDFSTLMYLGI